MYFLTDKTHPLIYYFVLDMLQFVSVICSCKYSVGEFIFILCEYFKTMKDIVPKETNMWIVRKGSLN